MKIKLNQTTVVIKLIQKINQKCKDNFLKRVVFMSCDILRQPWLYY